MKITDLLLQQSHYLLNFFKDMHYQSNIGYEFQLLCNNQQNFGKAQCSIFVFENFQSKNVLILVLKVVNNILIPNGTNLSKTSGRLLNFCLFYYSKLTNHEICVKCFSFTLIFCRDIFDLYFFPIVQLQECNFFRDLL